MWHEARRQERKIRGMLVDYRRRAERRRDFYEKIKADPTQFLQIHGRQYKIHLDPAIATAADSASAMMPWQGQADNLIDRFDVRAHLDYIPPVKKEDEEEATFEERQINYERYRIIAQNAFLGINEEKFLKQLHLEEQFGYTESKSKKEQRTGGMAIGFNYEDGTAQTLTPNDLNNDDDSEGNSDSDLDVDLAINVSKIDSVQAHEMNRHGRNFGMSSNDFYSFLTNDLEEAESFRLAKEEEHEKALFSGRKSRRERRAHREKRLANRVISPPSYAARTSPTYPTFRSSKSASKSPSPENTGKITYITSFGDDEETPSTSKPTYADKVKSGKNRKNSSSERTIYINKKRSYSRERSYSRKRRRRSRSRSRRSYSRDRYRKSRSRSRGRSRSYRRKRSSSSSTSSSSSSSSSSSRSTHRRKRVSASSRSKSPPSRKSSRSKSKTPPVVKKEIAPSPPKLIPRYYGRKKSDHSSSDDSDSSDKDDFKMADSPANSEKWGRHGNSGTVTKKSSQSSSIQERLKRKRQALLNKQFKADKIAEQLKTEREKQEQQNREDELREMAIKLRRRQREKRHAYDSNRSSSDSDSDSSESKSPPPAEPKPKSPSPYVCKKEEISKDSRRYETSRDRRDSRSPRRSSERRVYRDRRERRRDDREKSYKRDSYDRDRRDERRSLVDY